MKETKGVFGMKEIEVKRLLYQNSEAFKEGIEVGRKEALGVVKKMREAQKEFESDSPHMDYDRIMEVYHDKFRLESEVDELIKEIGV